MHVLDVKSHNYFKNTVKKDIYDTFNKEVEKRRGIKTLEEWLVYREKIMKVFKNAFPDEMFEKPDHINYEVVSKKEYENFNIENVLIESVKGWYVNATVYLPKEKGKYFGIVCPTGHSSKTFENYIKSNQVLARNGYISISFDPPGMRGEHQFGNDHFTDGVLSFLSGFWSNTYFILDAIRCIDYLESRDDVIKGNFGITGISGGGTSTIFTSILDDRIKASAPVCCVSNSLHQILEDNYTICPEVSGNLYHKYAIDSEMMLHLIAPTPLLLVGGEKDEILKYKLATNSMKYVKKIYKLYNKGKSANCFMDKNSGHKYSLAMIEKVVEFFNLNLKGEKKKALKLTIDDIVFIKEEELLCNPKDTTSFRSKNIEMFQKKERIVTKEKVAATFYNHPIEIKKMSEKVGPLKWVHTINRRIYDIDKEYKLPAIVLKRQNAKIKDVVLFFTDDGKWTHFINEGFLSIAGGYLQRTPIENEKEVISVDLSGFGELSIEGDGYDLSGWCTQLRNVTYELLFTGSSVIEYRVKEIMALLHYVENSKEFENIYMVGKGKASIPCLIASYLYGNCKKTTLIDLPISFETLTNHVPNKYLPDSVYFDAVNNFELYELVNASERIEIVNPRNGDYSINTDDLKSLYNEDVVVKFVEENNYEI